MQQSQAAHEIQGTMSFAILPKYQPDACYESDSAGAGINTAAWPVVQVRQGASHRASCRAALSEQGNEAVVDTARTRVRRPPIHCTTIGGMCQLQHLGWGLPINSC